MKIAVIGYSGHAYVCIESAICSGMDVFGYYDITDKAKNPYNLEYLGKESEIDHMSSSVFIAIGDNYIRRRVFEKLIEVDIVNIIAPSSIVSDTVKFGENVFVSSNVIVNALSVIGEGTILNSGSIVEHECQIGRFSHIGPGAVLTGNVTIGENCLIGANTVIKPGVKVGDNVIVGAGSVVIKDLEANSTYAGNPAKKINL